MDVGFGEVEGQDCPRQVAVAVVVVAGAGAREEEGDIRVATCAEEVVAAAAVLVRPVPGEAVRDDGHEGPHVGKTRPQAVEGRDVRAVELLGARGPEAFAGVCGRWLTGVKCWVMRGDGRGVRTVCVPDVQIADLRAVRGGDSDDGFRGTFPGAAGAGGGW